MVSRPEEIEQSDDAIRGLTTADGAGGAAQSGHSATGGWPGQHLHDDGVARLVAGQAGEDAAQRIAAGVAVVEGEPLGRGEAGASAGDPTGGRKGWRRY